MWNNQNESQKRSQDILSNKKIVVLDQSMATIGIYLADNILCKLKIILLWQNIHKNSTYYGTYTPDSPGVLPFRSLCSHNFNVYRFTNLNEGGKEVHIYKHTHAG